MTGIKDTHKLDTLFLSGSRKDGSLPFQKIYNMKDYDYLSLIVEISPQYQSCFEEIKDYEKVCRLYDVGDQKGILEFMLQWDYGEDTSDTQIELDKYEDVLIETDTHILAICESENFGWQGDAFFLYRKDKKK